jgi:hypothetical protein
MAETAKVLEGKSVETLIALIDDPAKREQLLALNRQAGLKGLTPEQILARNAVESPELARLLAEMERAKNQDRDREWDERKRMQQDMADRLERVDEIGVGQHGDGGQAGAGRHDREVGSGRRVERRRRSLNWAWSALNAEFRFPKARFAAIIAVAIWKPSGRRLPRRGPRPANPLRPRTPCGSRVPRRRANGSRNAGFAGRVAVAAARTERAAPAVEPAVEFDDDCPDFRIEYDAVQVFMEGFFSRSAFD